MNALKINKLPICRGFLEITCFGEVVVQRKKCDWFTNEKFRYLIENIVQRFFLFSRVISTDMQINTLKGTILFLVLDYLETEC